MTNRRDGRDPVQAEPASPPEPMILSDRELWLLRSALQSYLTCLTHGEGDLEHEIKDLIKKLQQWKCPGCAWSEITLPQAKKLTL